MQSLIRKLSTMVMVALDTNVIVTLVDDRDTWHTVAVAIRDALLKPQIQLIYFDCVFNETLGVIGRRTAEQKRTEQFNHLLDGLTALIPSPSLTWIASVATRLFAEIVSICLERTGMLYFQDYLFIL